MFLEAMDDISDPLAPKVPSFAQGMRILLVDRDTTSLMLMACILEAYSYKVTTIEILSFGMAIYEERKDEFDLIMVNLHPHDTTDLESIHEKIKKKDTPIILMSPAGAGALRGQDQLNGATHCMEKPLSCSQLRDVWQHVHRHRIIKEINGRNQTGDERLQEVEVEVPLLTRKSLGIDQIGEAGSGFRNPIGNEFPAAERNKRSGRDKKRAKDEEDDDDQKGEKKCQRTENNQSGRSSQQRRQGSLPWTKELHNKFTAAISKLGEAKANPRAIQELMKVPNLGYRQIAQQLDKYKAQVQLIMDTCRDAPPSQNAPKIANVTGAAGGAPPRSRPPLPDNRMRTDSGDRRQQMSSIQIRDRPPLPTTPFTTTNTKGKGKQILGFPAGNTTAPAPYVPLPHYPQNPTPISRIFPRLSSVNPPSSNLPAATTSTTNVAGASSNNPNIPVADRQPTGHGGVEDIDDDVAFLTQWLLRSLKADDTDAPNFDWMNTHKP